MLRLLTRRATVQLPLLFAVVAMVTIGATLLGVCALLLTVSQDQALNEGLAQAKPDDVSATAYVTDVNGTQGAAVAADTVATMTAALQPFAVADTDTRASSVTRPLAVQHGPDRQVGYFSALDHLDDRARLISGRWPNPTGSTGAHEAVVLQSTARRLGLSTGDRMGFGPENGSTDPGGPATITVVGIAQPSPGGGWDRDPLRGAGYDPAYTSLQYVSESAAFGPFIISATDLWATGATLDRMQVTVQPDLTRPTGPALDAAARSVNSADPRLKNVLGKRVGNERVASALPATLGQARFQQDVTRSTVLVVVLLGTVLTAAALGLAGRLMVSLRSTEAALFSAMGAGRSQLAAQAATEALLLAAIATVLAVPLSSLAHAGLTHLPRLADAGLAAPVSVTGTQVTTVLAGALLLAAILVVPALRPDPAQLGSGARGRLELLTRSGADLLLLVLAGAGWWQLSSQPAGASGTDAVRVVAPVLCLLAGAAVAPRLVAIPLRVGERLARTSRGVVLPLAVFEAARRPRAVAAGLLLALAAAAGTFGLAFGSTWERSQQDQAAAQVGTDLKVNLTEPVSAGESAIVAQATGGVVSPVTDRTVVLGRWMGDAGHVPRVIAVDSRQAGALLRGRLPDGRSWAEEGRRLTPKTPASGVTLATGGRAPITLTGTTTDVDEVVVVPRLVLQDRDGLRTPCDAEPVRLDGRSHELRACGPSGEGTQVVAVDLQLGMDTGGAQDTIATDVTRSRMSIELTLPSTAGATPATADWTPSSLGGSPLPIDTATIRAKVTAAPTGNTAVLRTVATINPQGIGTVEQPDLEVVLTPFPIPLSVPAVVSQDLADQLQTKIGDSLDATVGGTTVSMTVAGIVPLIPSAPGGVALLVDADALSRRLIGRGNIDPAVDTFWVGGPTHADAAARAGAAKLGPVVTRAEVTEQLRSGPLRVGLPAALLVLIPAVVLLVLAGTIMHVTSDVDARAVEIARLRGLGLTRRSILGGLLAQHGGMLALLLGCGAVVGVVTSVAVAPLLVRSDLGAAPVPVALAAWPWSSETALLAVLLLGSIAAVGLVVSIQLRRADATYLRVGA